MNDLFLHLICSGVLLALLLAPLGCFLIWNRMAFLSDTLSHTAILGTAIGIIFHLPLNIANLIFLCLFVMLLKFLWDKNIFSKDTTLSLLSYGGTSLGLVLLHFNSSDNVLHKVLFGDFLSLEQQDLKIFALLAFAVNAFLIKYQRQLILMILDSDLAKASNIPVEKFKTMFLLLTALIVGFSIYCVGALIVPALLIIPSCAVRPISQSYKKMILYAVIFSVIIMPISLLVIKKYDLPTGPSMVLAYMAGLIVIHIFQKIISVFNTKNKNVLKNNN